MANPFHEQEARAFAERLRKALARAGVRASPTVVANAFNAQYYGRSVAPHTARNWLLGKSIPTQDKLRVLAAWLDVEPNELRFGPSGRARAARDAGPLEARLNLADQAMLERYLALPASLQKTVRDLVQALSATGPDAPGRKTGAR